MTDEKRLALQAAAAAALARLPATIKVKPLFVPARLAGRCANGFERGAGSVVHALARAVVASGGYGAALCGKMPGPRSAGWCDRPGLAVTCPRCIAKLGKETV